MKGKGLDPQLHCSQCFALLICLAYWCFPFGELRVLSRPQTCTCVPSVISVYICAQTVCFPWEDLESPYKGVLLVEKVKNETKEHINGNWETGQALSPSAFGLFWREELWLRNPEPHRHTSLRSRSGPDSGLSYST